MHYIFHLFWLRATTCIYISRTRLFDCYCCCCLLYKLHKSKSACNNINLSCFILDVNIEFLSNNNLILCAVVCVSFHWRSDGCSFNIDCLNFFIFVHDFVLFLPFYVCFMYMSKKIVKQSVLSFVFNVQPIPINI